MGSARWLTGKEQALWRKTRLFQQVLDLAIDRQLQRDAGLSLSEYSVLVTLSESDTPGMRARDIGTALAWDRSRVSHQVRRMEQRGLVAKNACETDGRGTVVQLTPEGLEAIQASAPQHVEQVRDLYIDLLSADELDTLDSVFERVVQRVDQLEGIALPR